MPARHPADLVVRARYREAINFPDLTERLALRLSSVLSYTARAHFGAWHRKIGAPDFTDPRGVFTPLATVEIEVEDVAVDPRQRFQVRGETYLAKSVDQNGAVRNLMRQGKHTIYDARGTVVARARLTNVFTRYDPDPARRRVTELLGIDALIAADRRPDFTEERERVWHYGQTDANRHVNGMEYLRSMEQFVADGLHRAGHDLRRLFFRGARIVYRKPCFRGEGYRRVAWYRGEAPLVVGGAFLKANDSPGARPADAVELTLAQHE